MNGGRWNWGEIMRLVEKGVGVEEVGEDHPSPPSHIDLSMVPRL